MALNWIKNLVLKQKLKRISRKVQVQNWSTAKTALLIYECDEMGIPKNVLDFSRFLKEEGIKANVLGFMDSKPKEEEKPKEELNYFYFDRRELDLLGQPSSEKVKQLAQNQYDLLIDLNLKNRYPLKWICSCSTAAFKVGISGDYQNEACDLTIKTDRNSLEDSIEQIKKYLNIINK